MSTRPDTAKSTSVIVAPVLHLYCWTDASFTAPGPRRPVPFVHIFSLDPVLRTAASAPPQNVLSSQNSCRRGPRRRTPRLYVRHRPNAYINEQTQALLRRVRVIPSLPVAFFLFASSSEVRLRHHLKMSFHRKTSCRRDPTRRIPRLYGMHRPNTYIN